MFCCNVCNDDVDGGRGSKGLIYVEQELTDGATYKGYTLDGSVREGRGKFSIQGY